MMLGENVNSKVVLDHIPKNSIGLELGVWKGKTSKLFNNLTKELHLVDSWSPIPYRTTSEWESYETYLERYSSLTGSKDEESFFKYYDEVYEQVKNDFKDDASVIIHRMTTEDFFVHANKNNIKVDWVYIDASHDYQECYRDLMNCLEIVNDNGIIFGDDYHDRCKGVIKAVNEFVNNYNKKLQLLNSNQYKIYIGDN